MFDVYFDKVSTMILKNKVAIVSGALLIALASSAHAQGRELAEVTAQHDAHTAYRG